MHRLVALSVFVLLVGVVRGQACPTSGEVFENCVMGATTVTVGNATFRNVRWSGGTLNFADAVNVDIAIDNCTWTGMTSVLDWSSSGEIRNVTVRVSRSTIVARRNILAFTGWANTSITDVTFHVEHSTLQGRNGVMAMLTSHGSGERVLARIKMTAFNSTVAASGNTLGIAVMGIARSAASYPGDIRIDGLELTAVNSTVTATGASSYMYVAVLGVANRGATTANNTAFSFFGTRASSSGQQFLAVGGWSVYGALTGGNVSAAAVHSSVSCSGSYYLASMGWWAGDGNMQISNASTVAVHSSVSCSGSGSLILAMAAGAFSDSATPPTVTVTGLSFLCCNATLFSTENALTVVSRFGSGATYSILGTPTTSSIRYLLSNTTVTTQRSSAPHGDCLTIRPSGPLPSVIVNTTISCTGAAWQSSVPPGQLFMVNSGPTARFPGANTTFAPPVDCSVAIPNINFDFGNPDAAPAAPPPPLTPSPTKWATDGFLVDAFLLLAFSAPILLSLCSHCLPFALVDCTPRC